MSNENRNRTRGYTPSRGHFRGRRFPTRAAYRDALARSKGYRSYSAERRAYRSISSAAAIRKLTPIAQQKRTDALEVLRMMREGNLNLGSAVRGFNALHPDSRTKPETVKSYVFPAIRKVRRHWTARAQDRLLRIMRVPTSQGVQDLEVRDSRSATLIGRYWNAVKQYLETGDVESLREFRGKSVRVGKVGHPLLTNAEIVDQLAEGGEFAFESVYQTLAKG